MGDKKPDPKNVKKLAADAQKRQAEQVKKRKPTVAKQMRLRGGQPPAATPKKGSPDAVIKLISDAILRKGKKR